MAVPYCMIHYGKPYLEASGAVIAGIALGSLSMKTKSIYQGFLVHITVAGMMDWLALSHRNALPHTFWPNEERGMIVAYPDPFWTEHRVKMFLVLFALTMIGIVVVSRWKDIRALLGKSRSDMLQS
jgi:hypothetical protein